MPSANVADVAFSLQTAKGAAATTSAHRVYQAGGDQPHSEQTNADFLETTGARLLSDGYISEVHVAGAPQFYVMPDMIGILLYGALGAKSVTGAADPWTHVLVPAASGTPLPYLTFWRMLSAALFEKFGDCKISQLVIHGESGAPLTVTPTIMGLTPSYLTAAEATVAVEKTNRFMHYDGSGALKLEGAAVASIRSFDLTINNNESSIPGDSLAPNDVTEGSLEISLATTQLVVDFSLWKRLHYGSTTPANAAAHTTTLLELAGSPAGAEFTWTRVAASPGPARSLKIAIPRLEVLPFDHEPTTGNEPLLMTVNYKARQPAAGNAITATLLNGKASYIAP